jgi:hypothetical protein
MIMMRHFLRERQRERDNDESFIYIYIYWGGPLLNILASLSIRGTVKYRKEMPSDLCAGFVMFGDVKRYGYHEVRWMP